MIQKRVFGVLSKLSLVGVGVLISLAGMATAWTSPSSTAPNGNVSAPVNLSSTGQVKSGSLGVGGLAVFGNSLLQASSYLNWGTTAGSGGYGIRDNAGTLEFKNSGGSWASLQATIYNLGGTVSGTTGKLAKFTSSTSVGNSSITESSSGTLSGFSGGIGVGAVSYGWYSDGTNLAARTPSTSGSTYFQDSGGSRSWAVIGASVGGAYVVGKLTATGSLCVGSYCMSQAVGFGGEYQIDINNVCRIGNAFTGGCSCPGWAPYGRLSGYTSTPSGWDQGGAFDRYTYYCTT